MNEEKPATKSAEITEEIPVGETNFKQKRERFFAKREGVFLWLLAPPVLVVAVLVLVTILLWLARQVGVLSTISPL